ncbi:MAG: F0F1 ATP synthase subunit A [Ruminococcaceae bacterium]|nr:F0F1 ATP synthase subunit A [Oscillospiraceae bacterium]
MSISGARIYMTLPMPIQNLPITESQVNSAIVIVAVFFLCLYLTHGIKDGIWLKRHHFAEMIVEKCTGLVTNSMGEYFRAFAPFITAMLALSGFSSLITLFGLYAPTSDINIVAGWAILVFILITYYKMKCGPLEYVKSFGNPALMAPLNIISEIATPISMAFRHYGNVLSGSVIAVLVAAGLQGLSNMVFGALPGFFGKFPFLQVGLPAILSIYFDIFSGCLQAYIFAMLTMLYISGGFPLELYEARKKKRAQLCKN